MAAGVTGGHEARGRGGWRALLPCDSSMCRVWESVPSSENEEPHLCTRVKNWIGVTHTSAASFSVKSAPQLQRKVNPIRHHQEQIGTGDRKSAVSTESELLTHCGLGVEHHSVVCRMFGVDRIARSPAHLHGRFPEGESGQAAVLPPRVQTYRMTLNTV